MGNKWKETEPILRTDASWTLEGTNEPGWKELQTKWAIKHFSSWFFLLL